MNGLVTALSVWGRCAWKIYATTSERGCGLSTAQWVAIKEVLGVPKSDERNLSLLIGLHSLEQLPQEVIDEVLKHD